MVVMVVTDDPMLAEACRTGFSAGYEISFAADARVAIDAMRFVTPSLLVMDLQTGNAGGYALCKDMEQDGRLAGIPVLMLIDRPQDRWLATQAGAEKVLVKPVDMSAVVAEAQTLVPLPSR